MAGAFFVAGIAAVGVRSANFTAGGAREPKGSPALWTVFQPRVVRHLVTDSRCWPETNMSRNLRAFRELDRLDTLLSQLRHEIGFIVDLVASQPSHSLLVSSEGLTSVLTQIAERLDDARGMLRKETQVIRASPRRRGTPRS